MERSLRTMVDKRRRFQDGPKPCPSLDGAGHSDGSAGIQMALIRASVTPVESISVTSECRRGVQMRAWDTLRKTSSYPPS